MEKPTPKWVIVLIFLVLAGAASAAYYFWSRDQQAAQMAVDGVLQPYLALVREKKYAAAYELISDHLQGQYSLTAFAAAHQENTQQNGDLNEWEITLLEVVHEPKKSYARIRCRLQFARAGRNVSYDLNLAPTERINAMYLHLGSDLKHAIW